MKHIISVVILLAAAEGSFAQESAQSDSTKTFLIPEIVVTATRTSISPKDSPSPVEVVTSEDIRRINALTVADILRNSGGIFLQDYGSNGALKTASVRGLGSQHLMVLFNGNRINNFQNNLVDFSLLPLAGVERIEIVRGGSSALYGADALGGVVNILTREAMGTSLRAEGGIGSYGYRRYLIEGGTRLGSLGVFGGIGQEEGSDNYPFSLRTPLGEVSGTRGNAEFLKRHAFFHAGGNYDERSGSAVAAQIVQSRRGVPGSVSFPTLFARQDDESVILSADYHDHHLDKTEFVLRNSFTYSLQGYRDPDPSFPIEAQYKNRSVSVNPQFQFAFIPQSRLLVGGEFVEGRLDAQDFGGTIRRVQRSVYLSDETSFQSDRNYVDRLSVFGTVRYDDVSAIGSALSPKVGFNLRLLRGGDIRLRGSFGKNFHAPSFNDLYYPGFSNPLLKPERSTSVDLGLLSDLNAFGIRQSLEFTYFRLDTKDKILFDLTAFLPRNIGRSTSSGIEIRYEGVAGNGLYGAGANYSVVDAINKTAPGNPSYGKQLPFIPEQSASVWIWMHLGFLRTALVHNVVGRRYTTEDNETFLDSFGATNINISGQFPLGSIEVYGKLEVNNVVNNDYQIFPAYPMPRRTFRVTFGVEL